jgi:UDP-3-O-[3-hydroxymyristoyl] glucosamine N-acyltransferase
MRTTLEEIARLVGGEVVGDGSTEIVGVAGIREAGPGELTFVSNPRYEKYVAETSASGLVVSRKHDRDSRPGGTSLVVVDDPYDAFARVMGLFAPEGDTVAPGVHPAAVVAESAALGEGVSSRTARLLGAGPRSTRGSSLGGQ